jgi:hypothetical protein
MGAGMRARQLISHAGLAPHDLAVVLEGFEDAWAEIGPDLGSDPIMVEASRLSLARIVLDIARAGPIDRARINAGAVDAFRARYRIGNS